MFELPTLPYAYNALEPYIDEATMRIHHDLHHGTYVKNLNDALLKQDALLTMPIEELVGSLEKVSETVRQKVRNNAGGHLNHSMFWTIMRPPASGSTKPSGKIEAAIQGAFGSLKTFQEKFSETAIGRFGSGWAWVVVVDGKLSLTSTPNQDSPLMDGVVPILGLDVWEHAYYLKYQNRRAEYITNWWNVVDWTQVENRFAQAIRS